MLKPGAEIASERSPPREKNIQDHKLVRSDEADGDTEFKDFADEKKG
jgi:hypothetical protein